MTYKNAFNCKKCPKTNDETGCPMWWEIMETNPATGEERLTKDCGYQLLPTFLLESMKSGNRAAEAAESHRNAVITGLAQVANEVKEIQQSGTVLLQRQN